MSNPNVTNTDDNKFGFTRAKSSFKLKYSFREPKSPVNGTELSVTANTNKRSNYVTAERYTTYC